jgi:hypothetical protein
VDTTAGQKAEVAGRGQKGRGRGFDKGAVRVPGYLRALKEPQLRLISISYGVPVCCHGQRLRITPLSPKLSSIGRGAMSVTVGTFVGGLLQNDAK